MNIQPPFSIPKYPDTNEDKWRISKGDDVPIVLCDGASESFNSSLWAEILANGLSRHEDFGAAWLNDRIAEYEAQINPSKLSWSKQLSYERGSFATFLSVQVKNGKCLVNAIGDSEVFIIEDGWINESYPYNEADEFLAHPTLLSTKKGDNRILEDEFGERPYSAIFSLARASHIIMATDALAHWIMKRRDAEDWEALRFLLDIDKNSFREFVERERKSGLRLDDTTMIRIDLLTQPPIPYTTGLPAKVER